MPVTRTIAFQVDMPVIIGTANFLFAVPVCFYWGSIAVILDAR